MMELEVTSEQTANDGLLVESSSSLLSKITGLMQFAKYASDNNAVSLLSCDSF